MLFDPVAFVSSAGSLCGAWASALLDLMVDGGLRFILQIHKTKSSVTRNAKGAKQINPIPSYTEMSSDVSKGDRDSQELTQTREMKEQTGELEEMKYFR
jgi:hypothetical protein